MDCGGISGFYETLEAAADPSHGNCAEAKEWLTDYDPDTIDELPIKYGPRPHRQPPQPRPRSPRPEEIRVILMNSACTPGAAFAGGLQRT